MYAPPRPTMTTLSVLAASLITCCVISRTARRVSKTGSALGGVQAEPAQQRARLLILGLDLFARQLEPVGDLIDQLGVEKVGLDLGRQHVADRPAPGPDLPPDGDDRHRPSP